MTISRFALRSALLLVLLRPIDAAAGDKTKFTIAEIVEMIMLPQARPESYRPWEVRLPFDRSVRWSKVDLDRGVQSGTFTNLDFGSKKVDVRLEGNAIGMDQGVISVDRGENEAGLTEHEMRGKRSAVKLTKVACTDEGIFYRVAYKATAPEKKPAYVEFERSIGNHSSSDIVTVYLRPSRKQEYESSWSTDCPDPEYLKRFEENDAVIELSPSENKATKWPWALIGNSCIGNYMTSANGSSAEALMASCKSKKRKVSGGEVLTLNCGKHNGRELMFVYATTKKACLAARAR